jgi:hypothetical protein
MLQKYCGQKRREERKERVREVEGWSMRLTDREDIDRHGSCITKQRQGA